MAAAAPLRGHSFVFKLKHTSGTREETRRYGFRGDLAQGAVYTGLYDRTSQVFGLSKNSFYLAFADPYGRQFRLNNFGAFLDEVCHPTLDPATLARTKLDEKGRIVLVFYVRRELAETPRPAAEAEWTHEIETAMRRSRESFVDEADAREKGRLAYEEVQRAQAAFEAIGTSPPRCLPNPSETARVPGFSETSSPAPLSRPIPNQATATPYTWNWATAPPPPPHLPLSALFPSGSTSVSQAIDRPFAEVTEEEPPTSAKAGYEPKYVVEVPAEVPGVEAQASVDELELETEESEVKKEEVVEEKESWAGVKGMLKAFVLDLNRHLADNFGDEAAGFALRIPANVEEEVVENKVENRVAEKKVEESGEQPVHLTVFCDRCLKTIVGVRHKCVQCPNYDLCSHCLDHRTKFHPAKHAFAQVARPGALPVVHEITPAVDTSEPNVPDVAVPVVEKTNDEEVVHPATCDFCDETIRGTRHKCLNCPDTDACSTCFTSISTLHPLHNFVPLSSPFPLRLQPGDRTVHPHIACDACETFPILGVRYKCTHVDCPDFDMCSACEADPIPRHERSHHLLKIRQPVTSAARGRGVQEAMERARSVGVAPVAMRAGNGEEVEAFEKLIRTLKKTSVGAETEKTTMRERGVGIELPDFAQMVDGPGGDRTLVVDVDVEGASDEVRRMPAVMHFLIARSEQDEMEVLVAEAEKFDEEERRRIEEEQAAEYAEDDVHPEESVADVGYDVDQLIEEAEKEVVGHTEPQAKELDAIFVSDITLEDGSLVPAGGEFHKVWAVRNNGSQQWPAGTQLIHVGGFSASSKAFDVPAAQVGQVVELLCELKAPEDGGRLMDHWRLCTPEGVRFGHRFWVDITVESNDDALRNSGSFLSSSIVAPSLTAAGQTGTISTSPSIRTDAIDDDHASSVVDGGFESVRAMTDDEDTESSSEESSSVEESSEEESEDGFVVLSGDERSGDSESDEEWLAEA